LTAHIKKTGYPLEVQLSEMLTEYDWMTGSSSTYIDPDERKPREIDIYGLYFPWLKEPRAPSDLELVPFIPMMFVECKKSAEHSLVLFPGRQMFSSFMIEGQTFDLPFLSGKKPASLQGPFGFGAGGFIGPRLHYHGRIVSRSFSLTKPGGKPKSDVYEAVMILMKAQSYNYETIVSRIPESRPKKASSERQSYALPFTFLALAFDGPLFEAGFVEGDIELKELNMGLIQSTYWSTGLSRPVNYVIDVVRVDHFRDYLELIRDDVKTVKAKLKENERQAIDYFRQS